jgi:hypothetical protein
MRNSNKNINSSEPNGKRRERNSLKRISKMQSIEPPRSKHGTTSTKGLMKISHCGSRTRLKCPKQNTENSTRMSSRTRVTL